MVQEELVPGKGTQRSSEKGLRRGGDKLKIRDKVQCNPEVSKCANKSQSLSMSGNGSHVLKAVGSLVALPQ